MKIRGEQLKAAIDASEVTIEGLAEALSRTGLPAKKAEGAIRNWMRGNDHPRCKACDIERLAESLGVSVPTIARFSTQIRGHRGSPRKARLLADLVRGRHVGEAINLLQFSPKRAAVNMNKALGAAIADAETAGADPESLFIVDCRVDEGPTIKRFQPKDRGRAHPILKRTSHITIGLDDRSAGRDD